MDLYIKSLWLGKLNYTFLLFPFKFKDTKNIYTNEDIKSILNKYIKVVLLSDICL